MAFLGFSAGVVGVGVFLTRMIFGLDKITEDAYQHLQKEKKIEFEESLDKLEAFLNTEDADQLKMLRKAYKHHKEQVEKGDIVNNDELEEKLDKLFFACLEQLKVANELYNTAKTVMNKKSKKGILEKREQVLTEIKDTIQCFNTIIDGIAGIHTEKGTKVLSDLREDLQSSFEVVKRTEERIQELDRSETNVQRNREAF